MEKFKLSKKFYIKNFIANNIVFLIALFGAILTSFFVPIDKSYFQAIDFRTLTCLFCMLLVICALKNIYFFKILANRIVKIFKTTRSSISALIFITYFASMLIANDMALITFLPLSIIVLKSTHKEKFMIFTFIMQNIAANLGGMLTPFGNPQNLYLYNYFNIETGEFFKIMALPTIFSLILIIIPCIFIKKEPLILEMTEFDIKLDFKKAFIYLILFIYAIIIVFRITPFWTGLIVIPIIFIFDKKALKQVDYFLLLTFLMFFIMAGNLSRIEFLKNALTALINKNTLLAGALSCQIISNVPSAILLSGFTTNYKSLLMAVNIGGTGTLISSLASLITFKQFSIENHSKIKSYLFYFHLINLSFLSALVIFCSLIL